jgi:hypothetical protein
MDHIIAQIRAQTAIKMRIKYSIVRLFSERGKAFVKLS